MLLRTGFAEKPLVIPTHGTSLISLKAYGLSLQSCSEKGTNLDQGLETHEGQSKSGIEPGQRLLQTMLPMVRTVGPTGLHRLK